MTRSLQRLQGSSIKKRKFAATEVAEWCKENDLDSHLDKNHKKARYRLGKDAIRAQRIELAEAPAIIDDDMADEQGEHLISSSKIVPLTCQKYFPARWL